MLLKLRADKEIVVAPLTLSGLVHRSDVRFDGGGLGEEFVTQRTLEPLALVSLHVEVQPVVAHVALATDSTRVRHLVKMLQLHVFP